MKPSIFALVTILLVAPQGAASGQDQKIKAELQRAAIRRVLTAERMDRVVVVPTDPADVPAVAEIATKLGATGSAKVCNPAKPCDFTPEQGHLAVSAEVTSFDDSTATVRVVTWGKATKPSRDGSFPTFAAGQTYYFRKHLDQWVITGAGEYWET